VCAACGAHPGRARGVLPNPPPKPSAPNPRPNINQEALGGIPAVLTYGLRASGAASAFLMLVHFVAANAVVRLPALPRDPKPMAPVHAQHALSLLFTTHQVGAAPPPPRGPRAAQPRAASHPFPVRASDACSYRADLPPSKPCP
jgi:hypothetical protein